jgi:hypothetical protein
MTDTKVTDKATMRDPLPFRLVRREPDDGTMKAGADAVVCHAWSSAGERVADPETIFSAMLSASEPPTDAEIDELCRAMWGKEWYWHEQYGTDPVFRESQHARRRDRARMRKFLEHLS